VRLDSVWSPVAKYLATLPERYDEGEAYGRYRHAREATVDLLKKIAPRIKDLLTDEQRRKLPAIMTSYLDQRYLSAIRSGTAGAGGAGLFPGSFSSPGGGQETRVIVR